MSVNNTIEDWAKGLGSGSRVSANQTDKGDLKGWSATPTNEDAAHAVYAALKGATGRRKKAWRWSAVAKEVLGLRRMSTKRWAEIVQVGESMNLFHLDEDSLSFPILVVGTGEVQEEIVVEEIESTSPPKTQDWKRNREAWKSMTDSRPEGWTGPTTLGCGHIDWHSKAEHAKARENGKCCAGWKSTRQWRVAGLSMPVPENQRRSLSRPTSGWQGLCCDPTTGLYIGGVGNDCRHYHKGKVRCVVHGGKS